MVAKEPELMIVGGGDLCLPLQEIRQIGNICGGIRMEHALQVHEGPVQIHAVEQVGAVVIIGQGVKVLGQDEGLLAAPEEAFPGSLGDVDTGQDAVAAGAVVPVGPPVGQTAHGAVDAGAVHAEAAHMVMDQLRRILLVAGVVIIHGDAVPLILPGAVPALAGPLRVVLGDGELRRGAVGHIVEEDGHAQFVGTVAIEFTAFLAAVALVDDGLVVGMVDAVLVMVEDRQEPHMVDAHLLQLGQVLGILEQVLSHIEARVHGAVGMAGIHDTLGDAVGGGLKPQLGDDAPDQQVGVPVHFGAGRDVEGADGDGLAGLQVHLQARVIDIVGGIALTVDTAAPFLGPVDEQQVHMAAGEGGMGGAVDQTRLDCLQLLQFRAVAMPDGRVGGKIEDHILSPRQNRHEGAGIEVKRLGRGVLQGQVHLQPAALQPVADRHIGLGQPVEHIDAVFQLRNGSGHQIEELPRGLDGRQVPGAELQHGLIFQDAYGHLLIAAEVEAEAVERQRKALPADLQEPSQLLIKSAGKMRITQTDHGDTSIHSSG